MGRYEPDGVVILGAWSSAGTAMPFPADTKTGLGGQNLITQVFRSGGPVRMDDYGGATGAGADVGRGYGLPGAGGGALGVEPDVGESRDQAAKDLRGEIPGEAE